MTEIAMISFNALAPTFLIILCGYACKRVGVLSEKQQPSMSALGFQVFLPMLLFYNVYSSNVSIGDNLFIVAFCVAGVLLSFGLSVLFTVRYQKNPLRKGTMIQALYRSNYALLGIPIATSLYPDAVSQTSVSLAFVVPVYNVLAVIALEVFNGKKLDWRHILRGIGTNPLIMSSLLGVLLAAFHIRLPLFIEATIKSIAGIATPYLLFLLGVFFKMRFRIEKDLILCILGKLVVLPALMLALSLALGLRNGEMAIALALFASPPATSSFTMVQQLGGDAELAGNSVVLASALSFFTIFLWMCLLMRMGVM